MTLKSLFDLRNEMPEAIVHAVCAFGDRLCSGLGLDGTFAHLTVVLVKSYDECFHCSSSGWGWKNLTFRFQTVE